MSDDAADPHREFHYASLDYQSETALGGMWLFLATELLFFGALFLVYLVYRHGHPEGTAAASRHAELTLGAINTVLLLTSSLAYSYGLHRAEQGDNRRLFLACVATALLGIAFLGLKGYEWHDDFDKHLFPGADFAIQEPDRNGAQLFYVFYFVATGLHGAHMLIGIGLVAWVAWHARRGTYSPCYVSPVEAVGLYWSFVDMIWLLLFPMIYLAGRPGP